ncbi:hypothetical protein L1049_005053 [Liquidambar formosana]|uniref:Uncharacterized protein n=1 Tax=Liquidambar formosana TaxID=63359 RepID=A0AAP0RPI1_LIQFO
MARSLSQTLTFLSSKPLPPSSRLLTLRAQSSQSEKKIQFTDKTDTDVSADADLELVAFRKIEDAIHRIIVRRSAPDWLPFIPGSSYWVPPHNRSHGIAELVGKLANTLTEDEAMSFTTSRGWPSSAYFVKGASPHQMEVETTSNVTKSEDEEG